MTSKELNKLLLNNFPNLKSVYLDEVNWQEGDETGSHVVFGDVFTPYIVKMIESNNTAELLRIFHFLEEIFDSEDAYAINVVKASVLESRISLMNNKTLISMLEPKTYKVIEILKNKNN